MSNPVIRLTLQLLAIDVAAAGVYFSGLWEQAESGGRLLLGSMWSVLVLMVLVRGVARIRRRATPTA